MFPLGSRSNETPLDKLFLQSSYMYNENPSIRPAYEECSSFLHFPKSLLDPDDNVSVSHSLSQRQQHSFMGSPYLADDTEAIVMVTKDASNALANQQVPENEITKKSTHRKRSGKKDRHSKICTAQGPRVRRMRLSLPIAREFFDLQDMLGFDKASKTIEWLFNESKNAIKDLAKNLQPEKPGSSNDAKRMSSASKSEVVLGNNRRENDNQGLASIAIGESSNMTKPRVIKGRKVDKALSGRVTKESREKARERARERTREKMRNRGLCEKPKQSSDADPKKLANSLGNSSPSALTAFTEEREFQPHFQFQVAEPRMDSVHISENYLSFNIVGTSPSYAQSIAASTEMDSKGALTGFPENWENDWLAKTVKSSVSKELCDRILLEFDR